MVEYCVEYMPPSLNDPHVLGDGKIYIIIQASSQRTGTLRYAVVLALPHLTLPPLIQSTRMYITLPRLYITLLKFTILFYNSTSLYLALHFSIMALPHST